MLISNYIEQACMFFLNTNCRYLGQTTLRYVQGLREVGGFLGPFKAVFPTCSSGTFDHRFILFHFRRRPLPFVHQGRRHAPRQVDTNTSTLILPYRMLVLLPQTSGLDLHYHLGHGHHAELRRGCGHPHPRATRLRRILSRWWLPSCWFRVGFGNWGG